MSEQEMSGAGNLREVLERVEGRLAALESRVSKLEGKGETLEVVAEVDQARTQVAAVEKKIDVHEKPVELMPAREEKPLLSAAKREAFANMYKVAQGEIPKAEEPAKVVVPPQLPVERPIEAVPVKPVEAPKPVEPYALKEVPAAPVATPTASVVPSPPPPPPPSTTPRPPMAAAPQPARREKSLEATIGLKWAAWVGGLILFGGVLFFLKFAWDQGWLRLSPEMRVILAFVAGGVMIGVGELLHFKKMRVLAATLAAVGVAVIMSTFWAGHKVVDPPMFSATTAFIGAAATGVIGIALALQMNVLTLAILATLGMYVSPIVLSSGKDNSVALMVYLAVVTTMSLCISYAKRKWWALRAESFVFTWLWIFAWCAAAKVDDHPQLAMVVSGVAFLMFVVEAVAALHRAMRAPAERGDVERPESPNTILLESSLSALTFFNTALAMICYAIVFERMGAQNLWMVPLGLAAVMGLVTFATPSRAFSTSTAIQSLAMLVLAVPLYFEGASITYVWAVYALAFGVWAYLSNRTLARVWALVLVVLTLGKLFIVDLPFNSALRAKLFVLGDGDVSQWALMAWGIAVLCAVTAWLVKPRGGPETAVAGKKPANGKYYVGLVASVMILAMGTLGFVVATLYQLPNTAMGAGFLAAWVVGLGIAARVRNSVAPAVMSLLTLFVLLLAVYPMHLAATSNHLDTTLMEIGDLKLTGWLLLAWGTAAFTIGVGWLLESGKRADGMTPRFSLRHLTSVMLALATGGILLSISVVLPATVSSTLLLAAWAAGMVVIGRVHGSAVLKWLGIVSLAFLLVRLMTTELMGGGHIHQMRFELADVKVTSWLMLAWGMALLAMLMALLLRKPAENQDQSNVVPLNTSSLCAMLATAAFVIGCTAAMPFTTTWTLAIAVWAVGLAGASRVWKGSALGTLAAVLLVGLIVKWLMVDGFADAFKALGTAQLTLRPVANLFTLTAVLLVTGVVLLREIPRVVRAWVVGALAFMWVNFEAVRVVDYLMAQRAVVGLGSPWIVKNVTLSVLWGVIGLAAVVGGFIKRTAPVRWVALALLGVTAGKVLLVDMANVHTVLRVLSFMAVGVLLLAVSFAYHKFAKVFAGPK